MKRRQPAISETMQHRYGPGDLDEPAAWEWTAPPPLPPEPIKERHGASWELTLALMIVAVIIASVAILFGTQLWLADRVVPGLHVWDVDLGGLTRQQAQEKLESEFRLPTDRHPFLHYRDQVWKVRSENLDAQIDVPSSLQAAFAIGHRGDLLTRLNEQLDVLVNGRLVMPVLEYDSVAGAALLNDIARQLNRSLRNATLSLGDDLAVEVTPGQGGREVDESATWQALTEAFSRMDGSGAQLVVRETEPLITDVVPARTRVQQALSGPVVLKGPEDTSGTLEPGTLAGWLVIQPTSDDEGNALLSVALDPDQITRLAEDLATGIYRAPRNATFRWNDESQSVEAVTPSQPGRMLVVTETVSLIQDAVWTSERTVQLPIAVVQPVVATGDGQRLGITGLLAEGKTGFAGSTAARETNIVVGTEQFDGVLVGPGETFSFNHYLGPVTAAKGYEKSIIIWGNETRADVGGGLCQVSSTAFRAAFWAGLPIVERWPHTFRVSYYEPPKGLDATIYSPTVDLQWKNDTGHYILIHTNVNRKKKTLTFRLYGTDTGRTVEMDGPHESRPVPHGPPVYRDDPTLPQGTTRQIEWPKDGLDVKIHRVVREDGEVVQRDTFFSRYRPWTAVYLRGTKSQ